MPDSEMAVPLWASPRKLKLDDDDIESLAEIDAGDVLVAASWFYEAAPAPYAQLLDAKEKEKFS